MRSEFNPPASWYEPPEPVICCSLAEDDPDHDVQACMDEQAESAAEAKADRIRDDDREARWREP